MLFACRHLKAAVQHEKNFLLHKRREKALLSDNLHKQDGTGTVCERQTGHVEPLSQFVAGLQHCRHLVNPNFLLHSVSLWPPNLSPPRHPYCNLNSSGTFSKFSTCAAALAPYHWLRWFQQPGDQSVRRLRPARGAACCCGFPRWRRALFEPWLRVISIQEIRV